MAGVELPAGGGSSGLEDDQGRAVSYLRVSTVGQAVDGYGLDAQSAAIAQYATNAGLTITAMARDEGVSELLPAHERPGLMNAIAHIAGGHADVLIVARLDRLARDLTTQEVILGQCWGMDTAVHSADLGVVHADDPDDPMRTAMRQMVGVFAQLDRALVVKRLRDGRKAKAAQGGKAAGRYPYGWDRSGEVAAEQQILAYIADRRAFGHTWDQIADQLNANGLRPRTAALWSARNVAKVSGSLTMLGPTSTA